MPNAIELQEIPAIKWLIQDCCAALGERSTISAVINAIERGGSSGEPNSDIYNESHLTAVAKWRQIIPIWRATSAEHQEVLIAHYGDQIPATPRDSATVEWPLGVYGQMGEWWKIARVVLQPERVAKLIELCAQAGKGGHATIEAAKLKAQQALAAAHGAWREAEATLGLDQKTREQAEVAQWIRKAE